MIERNENPYIDACWAMYIVNAVVKKKLISIGIYSCTCSDAWIT
jgi:hypothetical protein